MGIRLCCDLLCEHDEIWIYDDDYLPRRLKIRCSQKATPIKCACCNEPTIMLDHFFPYYSEHNRCANCAWAESIISREERDKRMALINAVLGRVNDGNY